MTALDSTKECLLQLGVVSKTSLLKCPQINHDRAKKQVGQSALISHSLARVFADWYHTTGVSNWVVGVLL